ARVESDQRSIAQMSGQPVPVVGIRAEAVKQQHVSRVTRLVRFPLQQMEGDSVAFEPPVGRSFRRPIAKPAVARNSSGWTSLAFCAGGWRRLISTVVRAVKARTPFGTVSVDFIASMNALTKTSCARTEIWCATAGGRPAGSLAPFCPVPISKPFELTELKALMNCCLKLAGSEAAWLTAWSSSAVARWFCRRAPTTELPIAAPSCRVVFSTPEADPAIRGEMLRMATVVIGAKVMPMPAPAMMAGTRKLIQVESGPAT